MKLGIISDIHANLYALMELYNLLERENVDSIICLGDIVGYGPHPNEVINFIRRKHIISLKGIYDSSVINNDFTYINENTINSFSVNFTREELTKNNIYYLSNLPLHLDMKFSNLNIKFVHKNPYEDPCELKEDVLVHGFDHKRNSIKVSKDKFIFSPGSSGRLNSCGSDVSCGVLDINNGICDFKVLVSEYSFSKIYKDMKMMNFPEILINSYDTGKS